MNQEKMERAIKRIEKIQWKIFDDVKIPLYQILAKEYLRRLLLWHKSLDIVEHWPRSFFIIGLIDKNVSMDNTRIELLASYLRSEARVNLYTINLCLNYVL
jgi:hypothetical protein